MPKAFDQCVREGGKVRTKSLSNGKYAHICYPKDGGDSVSGYVKKKQKEKK